MKTVNVMCENVETGEVYRGFYHSTVAAIQSDRRISIEDATNLLMKSNELEPVSVKGVNVWIEEEIQ